MYPFYMNRVSLLASKMTGTLLPRRCAQQNCTRIFNIPTRTPHVHWDAHRLGPSTDKKRQLDILPNRIQDFSSGNYSITKRIQENYNGHFEITRFLQDQQEAPLQAGRKGYVFCCSPPGSAGLLAQSSTRLFVALSSKSNVQRWCNRVSSKENLGLRSSSSSIIETNPEVYVDEKICPPSRSPSRHDNIF